MLRKEPQVEIILEAPEKLEKKTFNQTSLNQCDCAIPMAGISLLLVILAAMNVSSQTSAYFKPRLCFKKL